MTAAIPRLQELARPENAGGTTGRASFAIDAKIWGDVIRASVLTAVARSAPILALLPFGAHVGDLRRRAGSGTAIAWQGQDDDRMYLGQGSAWRIEAFAPAEVRPALATVEVQMIAAAELAASCGVDTDFARAYGGLAFDVRRPAGHALAAFSVPAIMLRQRAIDAGTASGAVAVRVEPGDTGASVEDRARQLLADLARELETAPTQRPAGGWRIVDPARGQDAYAAAVRNAVTAIAERRIEKIVLSRDVEIAGGDPWATFERMAQAAPDTTRFALVLGSGELMVGASPERLVSISGGVARADCLAGTVTDGTEGPVVKERREHEVVARAIRTSLEPLCDEVVAPPEPVWRPAPGLFHLWSPIAARLAPGVPLGDVLLAVHPTPAVGGWPRDPAMGMILEFEGRPRGWYAGAIGWIGAREADFAVGIRSLRCHGERATLTVGAGIVEGSTPEGELEETGRKAQAVLNLSGGIR